MVNTKLNLCNILQQLVRERVDIIIIIIVIYSLLTARVYEVFIYYICTMVKLYIKG